MHSKTQQPKLHKTHPSRNLKKTNSTFKTKCRTKRKLIEKKQQLADYYFSIVVYVQRGIGQKKHYERKAKG